MSFFVIDTNVPVVANGYSEQADPDCVLSCIDALAEIYERGKVLLDDMQRILDEYRDQLEMSGQPGPGDAFMKWVWDNQANELFCIRVPITPLDDDLDDFMEFPRDPRLLHFDRSDRKFVAVAISSGESPEILNAVDTDWAQHFDALKSAGLKIRFLCPQFTEPGR